MSAPEGSPEKPPEAKPAVEPVPPATWSHLAQAAAIGLAALLVCAWQAGRLGMTWDEGCWYFAGARALSSWWAAGAPFDTFSLSRALHTDYHPPLIKLIAWAAHGFTPEAWPEWYRWRMGSPVLFGLTVGLVFHAVRSQLGLLAAGCAVGGLVAQPQLLVHASVLGTDAPIACFAVLALVGLAASARDARWLIVMDLALVGAMLTKLSALALVGAVGAAILALRDGRAFTHAWRASLVGLVLLVLLYPAWDLAEWFGHLGKLNKYPFHVQFLGERTTAPPWYWIWVMLAATPPVGWLAMVAAGCARLGRERDRWAVALLVPCAIWLLFFHTPVAPRHDNARQITFLCAALGVAGGIGLARLALRLVASQPPRRAAPLSALALLLPLSGLLAWWRDQPYPLSSWSGLVGGLSGAARLGFEPTYYWDALTPATWREVNGLLPPGAQVTTVFTAGYVVEAQRVGLARADLREAWNEDAEWFLVLQRSSFRSAKVLAAIERTEVVRAWSHEGVVLLELRRRRP